MGFVGVAQVLVLNDDHISIADFFEGAKAQVANTKLSHNYAAAPTTKKKKVQQEEKKKKKDFMAALNNTQLLTKKFISCDPAVVNPQGVFTRNIPFSSSSNDLQILERTE